ncbi:MAG: orotate phosphoribosyltransferase [Chitinophagaceae bacterium]|nr:orotate phosphoribosyltransferase [Chitinophagaceae bacterium]
MTNKKAVAQKLLQIKAIKLSPDNPFTWASGWKSPIYCDNRKSLSFPYIREFIKSELCNEVFTSFPDAEIVAGVATAGIPWGAMVSDQLKLPFVYVRSKPKDHGLGNQIEGYYEQGKSVVLIEDLVSTGKSSLEAAQALIDAGLQVVGMVSIFTYAFDVAVDAFKEKGIKLISLTDYPSLIQLATEQNIIDSEDQKALLNWRENPAEWGKFV